MSSGVPSRMNRCEKRTKNWARSQETWVQISSTYKLCGGPCLSLCPPAHLGGEAVVKLCMTPNTCLGIPRWLSAKESAYNAGDTGFMGSIPGSGRSPGEGHGNTLQYFCLEHPMVGGAWRATVQRTVKSRTRLCMHAHST